MKYYYWQQPIPPATPHWVIVSLKCVHVVQVGLPVLDEASVIGWCHPGSIVAPCHAANWTVMPLRGDVESQQGCVWEKDSSNYLKNGLKAEVDTIPESEFSTGSTRDQPTSIRYPLSKDKEHQWREREILEYHSYWDTVDRASRFVGRGTDKLCSHRIYWTFL